MHDAGSDVPTARPRMHLLASAVAWLAFVGLATWGIAWCVAAWVPLSSAFATHTALAFGVLALIVLTTVGSRHPFEHYGAANVVTTGRAALVTLVIGLAFETVAAQTALMACTVGLAVVTLDALDGTLARRTGRASEFGARFDMEVDAALILALCALAWLHGRAGSWVLLSGLYRYAFVAAGWAFPWLSRPLPPSRRRQAVCVLQILVLLIALPMAVPAGLAAFVLAAALFGLTWSFAVDVHWLWLARRGALPAQSRVDVA
ncbi:MAG: CDP-alcohol phosphatidyltransferase family protein [Vicinamibacterales bacterium]